MPPFVYQDYHNPYVQSISALLEAPGQIAGQSAIGQANAWNQAIQGATGAVQNAFAQAQAQKMNALKMQDLQGQIAERNALAAERQRSLAAQGAVEQAIKGAIDPTTGKVDQGKAADAIEAAGYPTQANAYREANQKTQATALQLQSAQAKIDEGKKQLQQASIDHLAELGAAGLDKLQSSSPLEARDYAMGLVANAATHGLVNPDDAKQMLAQTVGAGPDQIAGIYQQLVDASSTVKERIIADNLKKAETAKNLAEANKANAPQGGNTEAAMDAAFQALETKRLSGQPLTPVEQAQWQAYKNRKTVSVDASASAAAGRQANALQGQVDNQARAQKFQEQEAGKKELTDKVIAPYQTALSSAQTLRDTVALAKSGNVSAAALQSLETTMAAIRQQGLNRVNTAEIGVSANAGSLWDSIQNRVGKLTAGQPVDPKLQHDMLQFAGMMEKQAYRKYSQGHESTTKTYDLNVPKEDGPTLYARDPKGVLHSAPWGTKIPSDWVPE